MCSRVGANPDPLSHPTTEMPPEHVAATGAVPRCQSPGGDLILHKRPAPRRSRESATADTLVQPDGAPPPDLRRTGLLIEGFAHLAGLALVAHLLTATGGPVRLAAALAVLAVLAAWLLRPAPGGWPVALAEGLAAAALPPAGLLPVLAFACGAALRRARFGAGLPRLLCAPAGCAAGLLTTAPPPTPGLVTAHALPLAGVVVAALALHGAARAARHADHARLLLESTHRAIAAMVHASPVGLALLDDTGLPRLLNDHARALLDRAGEAGRVPCAHGPDITRCHRCRATGAEPAELRLEHPDGTTTVLEVHAVAVEPPAGPDQTVIAAVDVSRRSRHEEALRARSERDALTGLVGRAHFLHLVDQALAETRVGLLLVDLDRFKEINDTEGHQAGDSYLALAAGRIRASAGPGATAARLGGDEFAVLAHDHDAHECLDLGRRLLAALSEPLPGSGRVDRMGASVGVAVSAPGTRTAELLRNADTAMYAAKREGGSRIRLFHPEMGERLLARRRDKAELLAALDTGALPLRFRPIVELGSSRVAGAQALVDWRRPGHGALRPEEFAGMAAEAGLLGRVADRVLRGACEQAARWHDRGRALGVTVGLPTRRLAAPGAAGSVEEVLRDTGLPPDRLTVEATGSAWTDRAALQTLLELRGLGVRTALDGFGTGTAGHPRRYPFDVVRIDRSLTAALRETARGAHVVRCVIDLAEVLGAQTVAEGIETREQADWLRWAGCAFAQGPVFGAADLVD